jgi:exopolysaccharide biosynthesis WecB/TagA/CpsF family protein
MSSGDLAAAPQGALSIDDYDVAEFGAIAAGFGHEHYGYVVTPNVDHVIRYCDDPQFRALYADAAYVLLDSRFLARCLATLRGQRARVCPGSDLTRWVLQRAIAPDDCVILVGGTGAQAQRLSKQFGLRGLIHIDPPMGFLQDSAEVERCLLGIEAASPFRYCFLAIGSPQQEILAQRLKVRAKALGLVLCVGASINFLTGTERRAPRWMQWLGLEWVFRLLQNPRRLATRYLIRGPRIFLLLPRVKVVLRRTGLKSVPSVARQHSSARD